MDLEASVSYLFDISKHIKHFYETPVIFLTKTDFSDSIFNALCSLRSVLSEKLPNSQLIDIIVDFHLQWLHAVNEIEIFKSRLADLSKDEVYQAVSYTIDAMTNRLKYYQLYMEKNRSTLSNLEQSNLISDLEIVEDMHKEVTRRLLEKLKCFRNFIGDEEFTIKIKYELEELLHWVDIIYDELSVHLSHYVSIHAPELSTDLAKTLYQIVNELNSSQTLSAQKILHELKQKGKELGSMIRCVACHDIEISKINEKIDFLEDRIESLQDEPSAAVIALKQNKNYLENRLASLENLKTTLQNMRDLSDGQLENLEEEEELCPCKDFYQLRIFNHALPPLEREKLVTELCYLWDSAVFGERDHKSIISILSAADIRQEYTDELGTYYIDQHSRKIYKLVDDDTLYQPNENNELVPISDDSDHVFFYDECGRYFIVSKTRQRIYKAHGTTSEYMMDSSAVLLKIKEERDGVTYYYDNYGRYHIDDNGKHIYREADAISEYENDGLGNLVRIRSHLDLFEVCPDEINVTEDFKFLKEVIGHALRVSIADCILYQPSDPIKFLADKLVKYRQNMEQQEMRNREKEELLIEREFRKAEEMEAAERAAREAALLLKGGSEASYDSNLFNYAGITSNTDDGTAMDESPK